MASLGVAGMPSLAAGSGKFGGYRTAIQGVAMHRHNDPGTCRAGAYVIDDWR